MISQEIVACQKCSLRLGCNQPVAGVGNLQAKIFIVGESASKEDDLMQEPFSDQGGQLLNKWLETSGLDRADVYITHLLKCMADKPLSKLAIDSCKNWLWKEIKEVKPTIIVTLGILPARLLLKLKSTTPMSEVAGVFHDVLYSDAIIVPWYHPNYVLNQGKKLEEQSIRLFKQIKEQVCREIGRTGCHD